MIETLTQRTPFFGNISFPETRLKFNLGYITYSPSVNIFIESKNYVLKTAKKSDLINLFKLRSFIFEQDDELDFDEFDLTCDHLIITNKNNNQICGTYRVNSTLLTNNFYSSTEFDLTDFLAQPGTKMELGRAAISPLHRNGTVIDLLWKGIGVYATQINAKYVFGCSSVFGVSPTIAKSISHLLLSNDQTDTSSSVKPTPKYTQQYWEDIRVIDDERFIQGQIPPLLKSYLNAGAKVHGAPALDAPWDCYDFFTVLDTDSIRPSFKRRYFSTNGAK